MVVAMSLSAEERERFRSLGVLGPFKLLEPDDALAIGRRLMGEVYPQPNWIYAHTKGDFAMMDFSRDRHLDSPLLYRLCADPAIVDRVIPFLGPDVLFWRTDFFERGPEDPPTSPHQDEELSGTRNRPMIAVSATPRAAGSSIEILNTIGVPLCVSAWIAFSKVTAESGAMWVVPGSGKDGVIPEIPSTGFAGRQLTLSREFAPEERVPLEMEAGEFVLFDNLIVHGSVPVRGDTRRLAVTARFVSTETYVHPLGEINAQGQDLSRFGSVLVAGTDLHKRNVLRAPPRIGLGSVRDEAAICDLT